MACYEEFSKVYDLFMDNVPYEEWGDFIKQQLAGAGITEGLVLDLGCGTGKMTRLLSEAGYDMIGVDCSVDMLNVAREQEAEANSVLYLCQDMREFELYGTVRAVICVCDSLNYLLTGEDLCQVFCLVNNYLDPGGLFIFDINTDYKYREILGDTTICENREEGSFIWENFYDEESGINEYDLTIYILEDGRYDRFEETHVQRGYDLQTVKTLLAKAGLEFVQAVDAETFQEVTQTSGRLYIVAKEIQKTKEVEPGVKNG